MMAFASVMLWADDAARSCRLLNQWAVAFFIGSGAHTDLTNVCRPSIISAGVGVVSNNIGLLWDSISSLCNCPHNVFPFVCSNVIRSVAKSVADGTPSFARRAFIFKSALFCENSIANFAAFAVIIPSIRLVQASIDMPSATEMCSGYRIDAPHQSMVSEKVQSALEAFSAPSRQTTSFHQATCSRYRDELVRAYCSPV
jgi:hypothetical protein